MGGWRKDAAKTLFCGVVAVTCQVTAFGIFASDAQAQQQYASKNRTNAALGHYARARAMLVEALAEFEQGRKYARPDMLLDPEEWRLSVVSRTEELNRVIDPRPRVTRAGVQFRANKMLIRRERDRLPAVTDGAQDRNTYGEEQRKKELQATRAQLANDSVTAAQVNEAINEIVKDNSEREKADTGSKAGLVFSGEDEGIQEQAVEAPPAKAAAAGVTGTPTPGESATESEEEEVAVTGAVDPKRTLFGDPAPGKAAEAKQPSKAVNPAGTSSIASEGEEGESADPRGKAVDDLISKRLGSVDAPNTVTEEEVLEEDPAAE